ncbi:CcmD family protein [Persicobacter psychrovividus]|uniref:CcmD family protein n=1 Tax=Persicobacter psychrovividus TaxID=387638 RepID=A0ABM7VGH5_9BACT|nr:hypothetical protein PEPS_23040 [Persicobacter psychrovividus]
MKKIFLTLLAAGTFSSTFAQDKIPVEQKDYENTQVQMADNFRGEGKIYVVVAVALTVLGGFAGYAFRIDKQLSRLESEIEKQ